MHAHVQACLFDLYDTLVHFDEVAYAHKVEVLAAVCGVAPSDYARAWKSLVVESNLGLFRDTKDRAARALELLGKPVSDLVASQIAEEEHSFLREHSLLCPGARDILSLLRQAGIATAIVTNASPSVWHVLRAHALDAAVDCVVVSCEIGIRKPDPRIYHEAMNRLGVRPEQAAFVGDGNDEELEGAKRAGLTTVLLDSARFRAVEGQQSSPGCVDLTIHSLLDLARALSLT